jgi:hypothetical protein
VKVGPSIGRLVSMTRADRKLVERAFDRTWYLGRYPDVRAAKFDPVSHFLKWGSGEGRHPNPLFWTEFYVRQYPTVSISGINPLLHYLLCGWREGYDPNPLFDSGWYLRKNEDVAAAGMNPLTHYLQCGAHEGRDPHPLFDTDWYLEQNPEVRSTLANPLQHFLDVGGRVGMSPHSMFDSVFYLESNPDVRDSGANPLLDYLEFGAKIGRNPNKWFDNEGYMERYPDVRKSGLNPLIHYRLYGAQRRLDPSAKPEPPQDQDTKELDPKSLFDAFQSLGDNCELGLVQKHYRSNLLGLFKFASSPINGLIAALRSRFRDFTSPECMEIEALSGSEEGQREYFLVPRPYGIWFHIGLRAIVEPDKLKTFEARRLQLLVDGFTEDLARAEKIFVYKTNDSMAQTHIEELVSEMRVYGPATLLWVTVATDGHPSGSVEHISEGLMRGYIERLAPYDDIMSYSAEAWRALCATAYAAWRAQQIAQRKTPSDGSNGRNLF